MTFSSTTPAQAGVQPRAAAWRRVAGATGRVAAGLRPAPGWTALALATLTFGTAVVATAGEPAKVVDAAITADGYPPALSAYGFFTDLKARTPAARVVPYALNTALFSDYAAKQRYVYVPVGTPAAYNADAVLDFPVGSALIKTVGSSRVDLQACKLEYSIVSPK